MVEFSVHFDHRLDASGLRGHLGARKPVAPLHRDGKPTPPDQASARLLRLGQRISRVHPLRVRSPLASGGGAFSASLQQPLT